MNSNKLNVISDNVNDIQYTKKRLNTIQKFKTSLISGYFIPPGNSFYHY